MLYKYTKTSLGLKKHAEAIARSRNAEAHLKVEVGTIDIESYFSHYILIKKYFYAYLLMKAGASKAYLTEYVLNEYY